MAKEFSIKFYRSKSWKKCRQGYIESVNGLCVRCQKENKQTPGYIVHHTTTLTPGNINNPDITLNWDRLEYVCLDCHNKFHFGKYSPIQDGLGFDSNGNLIQKNY